MALKRRTIHVLVAIALVCAAAAYLRDPPWLLATTAGLRAWEIDREGHRYRWTGGHASFFVPADAPGIEMPLRTTFDQAGDWPVTVSVSIDDRPSDRVVLADDGWQTLIIRLPQKGNRRVRRIDVRVDRTRDGNRGVALGEIRIHN